MYLATPCQNAPHFTPALWHFSPQVQKRYYYITKRTREPLKISFYFQCADKTVLYVSTHGD